MSPYRTRQLLGISAAVAVAITMIACGKGGSGTPSADTTPDTSVSPSSTDDGSGEAGQVSTSPSTATSSAGGQQSQQPTNPYPGNAKDYGLKFLATVKSNDQTKIVDLGSVTVYSDVIGNYSAQNLNGSWTYSNAANGAVYFYNAKGNLAEVNIDNSKLGKAHAVTNARFDSSGWPSTASDYVSKFVATYNGGGGTVLDSQVVLQNALATDGVVNKAKSTSSSKMTYSGGGTADCGSGKKCLETADSFAGGAPFGNCLTFVVTSSKVGGADAITDLKDDGDCNPATN